MKSRGDKASWVDVELPFILRYRKNPFLLHFIVPVLLLLGAVLCVMFFGRLLAGLPLLIAGGMALVLVVAPMRHVRNIDHVEIDSDALTLVQKDGSAYRIDLGPRVTFAVTYEQCCRSIVALPTAGHSAFEGEHVIADALDLPRGLDIYGLCDLLNSFSRRTILGVAPGTAPAIRRSRDWYRDPARMSRLVFLFGMAAIFVLFVSVQAALAILTHSWSVLAGKPLLFLAKTFIALLFVYPAFSYLAVARLRDLGEPATHRNALGLAANRAAGGFLRLVLRRGEAGRNQFGPQPRF